jgi:hypothetical protein
MPSKDPTADMIAELVEIDEVLSVLDQRAMAYGPAPSRAFSRWYNELIDLRDSELKDWNEDASSGLHDRRRVLYRCDEAAHPYHTTADDGPCEVYTPNWDASAGKGAVSLCDLHEQIRIDAGGELSPAAKSRRLA